MANTGRAFTKGQPVTLFQNWDSKGTIRVVDLIVHSCGVKQMVLVDATGAKFEGRNFHASVSQSFGGWYRGEVINQVQPRMTVAEAEAFALDLGALHNRLERLHIADRIQDALTGIYKDAPTTPGYVRGMEKHEADLHEPRVFREGGL